MREIICKMKKEKNCKEGGCFCVVSIGQWSILGSVQSLVILCWLSTPPPWLTGGSPCHPIPPFNPFIIQMTFLFRGSFVLCCLSRLEWIILLMTFLRIFVSFVRQYVDRGRDRSNPPLITLLILFSQINFLAMNCPLLIDIHHLSSEHQTFLSASTLVRTLTIMCVC